MSTALAPVRDVAGANAATEEPGSPAHIARLKSELANAEENASGSALEAQAREAELSEARAAYELVTAKTEALRMAFDEDPSKKGEYLDALRGQEMPLADVQRAERRASAANSRAGTDESARVLAERAVARGERQRAHRAALMAETEAESRFASARAKAQKALEAEAAAEQVWLDKRDERVRIAAEVDGNAEVVRESQLHDVLTTRRELSMNGIVRRFVSIRMMVAVLALEYRRAHNARVSALREYASLKHDNSLLSGREGLGRPLLGLHDLARRATAESSGEGHDVMAEFVNNRIASAAQDHVNLSAQKEAYEASNAAKLAAAETTPQVNSESDVEDEPSGTENG